MRLFTVIFLMSCIGTLAVAKPAVAATRPNVLLVIADDMGYGDLACHGNPHTRTPQIDQLAAASIRFDRFFVSPLCAPTRASLLTGRYSLRTGVKGVARGEETMRPEEVTIAETLRDAGYRTGLFGKWHNGEHFPCTPLGQGFQESFGYNLGHWNNYFNTTLKRNGEWEKTNGYIVDVTTDAALQFLTVARDEPFFCFVSYATPHSPFQVPDRYFDHYKSLGLNDRLACIYGMVENLDDNVGRLLTKLDDLRLRENTIVIFLSDNGPNGERFNAGMRGAKGSLHEGGSRVPFFVNWPARFRESRVIPQVAAHIDLFPTLIELCGVPAPKTLPQDGRSLVPLLNGQTAGWENRYLFTQHLLGLRLRTTGAVRSQRHRCVNDGRGWELFDMERDPSQKQNIAAEQPELVQEMSKAFAGWWNDVLPEATRPRAPIQIGHAEENPVELPTPQAGFGGELRFSGKHPNNAWLTNWINTTDKIEWEVEVVAPGTYEVQLLYQCDQPNAGARLRISSPHANLETVIPATPVVQVPSPDRVPRDEVYEREWATHSAGSLVLPVGKTTLTLQALTKLGESVLDLKSLILKR